MKIFYTFFTLMLIAFQGTSQSDVYLRINHLLGVNNFSTQTATQNNLNNDFRVDRLEYYISEITVTYNQGVDTTINDLWILVDAQQATDVFLANLNVDSITQISFGIGVDSQHNHLDPSTYSAGHPLGHHSPSMHWGWTSGYRFVAMEGKCDANFNQNFQIHALGDRNYGYATIETVGRDTLNGDLVIELDADYNMALKDIDISGGLIEHSENGAAVDILLNFRTNVFSSKPVNNTTSISESLRKDKIQIFPNPVSSDQTLTINSNSNTIDKVEIVDIQGKVVHSETFRGQLMQIDVSMEAGIYMLRFSQDGRFVDISRLIITD